VTHVITDPCIGSKDRSCVEVCPVDCIYEVEQMLVIHPEECIDCGACVPECPVEAIFSDSDLPAVARPFLGVNAAIRDGIEAVDAALAGALVEASSTSAEQRGQLS
jgi:NAD-dependent dihydropyrimidine dehydrogenase PreA subunit